MVIQVQLQSHPNYSMNPGLHGKQGPKVQWTKAQLMEAFKRYDLNGDGKLSKEELKKAFNYLGSAWGGFRAGRAMSCFDADKSGFIEISNEEMDDLVGYAFECGYKVRTQ